MLMSSLNCGCLYCVEIFQIQLLTKSDGHPNVVRYYATEEVGQFVHLVLERCEGTLAAEIAACAKRRDAAARSINSAKRGWAIAMVRAPPPSDPTKRFLFELAQGVAHLHHMRIIHRDLKPQNVLLAEISSEDASVDAPSRRYVEHHKLGVRWRAKISDMGLSKQLGEEGSSFSTSLPINPLSKQTALDGMLLAAAGPTDSSSARAVGTSGWQAPEVLRLTATGRQFLESRDAFDEGQWTTVRARGVALTAEQSDDVARRTRSVDVWGLGCVMFHVIHAGGHPFGSEVERNSNILTHYPRDLALIEHLPEAHSLISAMIDPNPNNRPKARQVCEHPFFWSDATRLSFFQVCTQLI